MIDEWNASSVASCDVIESMCKVDHVSNWKWLAKANRPKSQFHEAVCDVNPGRRVGSKMRGISGSQDIAAFGCNLAPKKNDSFEGSFERMNCDQPSSPQKSFAGYPRFQDSVTPVSVQGKLNILKQSRSSIIAAQLILRVIPPVS